MPGENLVKSHGAVIMKKNKHREQGLFVIHTQLEVSGRMPTYSLVVDDITMKISKSITYMSSSRYVAHFINIYQF